MYVPQVRICTITIFSKSLALCQNGSVQGDIEYDRSIFSDVIFSQRRGQSQKPEEIYHLIESLVPNGTYLLLFIC